MTQKALQILEFHKIINHLTELASSEPGRKKCASLKPSCRLDEIDQAQTETADALNRIFKKNLYKLGFFLVAIVFAVIGIYVFVRKRVRKADSCAIVIAF